jgi:ATP-binding cassette subfamily B protein
MAFMLLLTGKIGGKSGSYFLKQQKSIGSLNGYIEEMINGQKVIKVFCHEEEAKREFDRRNDELCFQATKANAYSNIMGPIMNNLGNLQYVLIAVAGGALAINGIGGLTIGAIAAFLQLSRSINMPIGQVSQQFNSIVMALAGAERIFGLMDEEIEKDDGYVTLVNARYADEENHEASAVIESETHTGLWAWKHPHHDGTITYTPLSGEVRFTDVDFGYEENKIVLHNVSLFAEPGHKIAFVGATGAGKTTITNLINRFYDIADGKIRYDGININKIRKSDLRRSLGIVLQDTNLFTGTVKENIRYGKLDASDEEVIAAAKLANADDFISRLPDGYDTELSGDGGSLSQGQRQLLSIARAAIADPPVMILDEATSSIDTRTEAIIQSGMDRLMQNRTVFVIAHRLSTIQNANAIMVLSAGRIIERGNHEELLAKKGTYYQLYTGAFELE